MITREELWLSAIIGGTECNLVPITRKEIYYAAILGSGTDMLPVTREETYLYAIANGQSTSLEPVTRAEMYLYAVANGTECGLQPITRIERLLSAWTQSKPFTIVDKTPYILRQTAGGVSVGRKKKMTLVGGTVAWNQLVDTATETVATVSGRKYLTRISGTDSVITGDGTDLSVTGGTDNVHDLTQMFGTTVAAQMTVAKFRALFPETNYGYNAGTLLSVKTSEHFTTTSYPLDSDLELRGLPKLDSDNGLYYDGDVYKADGTVTRKFEIVNLGEKNWIYNDRFSYPYFTEQDADTTLNNTNGRITVVCARYTSIANRALTAFRGSNYNGCVCVRSDANSNRLLIQDSSYTDAATFKIAMSGVFLVYELATPTTETAEPYAATMAVDPEGTEQFVDSRSVKIPVGQDTLYQEP